MGDRNLSRFNRDRTAAARKRRRPSSEVRWGALALGFIVLVTGVVAVFSGQSDAGAAALVTLGVLTLAVGLLGDELDSIRWGDLELRLRDKADAAARKGDLETARVLTAAADTLGQRVSAVADSYKQWRLDLPPGDARTEKLEEIISKAGEDAHAQDVDAERVLNLLWTGSEGARVWALGVLEVRPELATVRAVLEAVERPDQMFDQYHALVLAEEYVRLPSSGKWQCERVRRAVKSQLDRGAFGSDLDCLESAARLLDGWTPARAGATGV